MSRSSLDYSICFLHIYICKEIPNYFSKQWNMWTETFKKNHGPCCISYCELSSAIAFVVYSAGKRWCYGIYSMKSASVQSFQLFSLFTIHQNLHDCSGKAHTHMHSCKLLTDKSYSRCICSLLCSIFFFCYCDTQTPPHTCTHRFQLWGQGVLVVLESTVCFNECLWGHCECSKQRKQACFFCFIFFFFFFC